MTNLELLTAAEQELSFEDTNRFDAYMLGSLSVLVSADTWQHALELTTAYITRKQSERAAAADPAAVSCAKCGKRVARADAVEDEDEDGATWLYCSQWCREKH